MKTSKVLPCNGCEKPRLFIIDGRYGRCDTCGTAYTMAEIDKLPPVVTTLPTTPQPVVSSKNPIFLNMDISQMDTNSLEVLKRALYSIQENNRIKSQFNFGEAAKGVSQLLQVK